MNWFQKLSAIRQNAYYTSNLFTVLALLIGAATLLWLFIERDTYPTEYYLYLVEQGWTPLILVTYFCLFSNFMENIVMIVVKKRRYGDLLHLPMSVWYAWSVIVTYFVGNLKGLCGIRMDWFLTPKFLRGYIVTFPVVPLTIRAGKFLLFVTMIAIYFMEGVVFGWGDIFALLWIPALLLAAIE
jgi:hypothetical protein